METQIQNLSAEIQSMALNLGKDLSGSMFESVSDATSHIQSQTVEQEMVLGDQATEIRSALGVGEENVPGYLAEATSDMASQIGAAVEGAGDSLMDLLPTAGAEVDLGFAAEGAGMAAGLDMPGLGGLESAAESIFAAIDPSGLGQAKELMGGLQDQGIGLLSDAQGQFMNSAKDLARTQSQGMSLAA